MSVLFETSIGDLVVELFSACEANLHYPSDGVAGEQLKSVPWPARIS